ncbi:hypothetical protein BHECKSOX_2011 [Bathymodiolus heckerae thiotrophic gill symbiont]|uniref:TraE/TraK family type IV conjugative transfer system protein n=1 Tax=Bathymodiolus heckerae thiotrophic gill symbiont TaxID=1052212 RepID=UPI0010B5F727|nr:TraE/TraK family type IV conjugative transfer system protein [Bathymodiolus heckerae thiotrophic gill symbiont]CAC9585925.1 hypothetical protein [uncultured Gammaproteobacteria bacterium]SHN89543.1 hypothetical protein BHECKSOX_2011 [Bathymodiolus heckerae thiotrophic gill symbiont]
MNLNLLQTTNALKKQEVNLLRGSFVVFLLISIFNYSSIESIKNNEKIIVKTLNQSSQFWVSSVDASDEYLVDFGLYAAQLKNNVTPSNVKLNFAKLLELVHPSSHESIKQQLKDEATQIQRYSRNAYTFNVTKTDINRKTQQIFIKGGATRWTNSGKKQPQRKTLTIGYRIDNALFTITSIKEENYE